MANKKPVAKAKKVVAKKPIKKAAPAKKAVAKKAAPAKKAVAKKVVAKKAAPAKKVVAKKPAPAKKVVAKKPAPAKKVIAKKAAPAKKVVAKKPAPAKKIVAKKAVPAKKVVAKKPALAKKVVAKKTAPAQKPIVKATVKPTSKPIVAKPMTPKVVAPVKNIPAPKPVIEKKSSEVIMNTVKPSSPERARYSDVELKEFKELVVKKLDEARIELVNLQAQIINANENGTDDTSASFKMLEDGSDTLAKEEAANLAARQKKFIEQLESALIRIENKTYGICRVTGKLIPKERLRAVPHTTQSMEAKLNQYKN
jgi:RNA polymerase-binding transcription factor DksA